VRLIDVLARLIEEALASRRKVGTVTAIVGTKVRVTVDNGSVDLPRLASYTPTVGDVVQIDAMVSGSWLVLGKAA
jgi:hypothetical protein